jgi:predicted permease
VTDNPRTDSRSGRERNRQNQGRILLLAFVWALSFVTVTLEIEKEWLPFGATLAGVVANAIFGIATVLAYRRFLRETDELRRKIEVEALALAFGAGVVGGLTYWLLMVSGVLPAYGFAYIFALMILTHTVGVLVGLRRYS